MIFVEMKPIPCRFQENALYQDQYGYQAIIDPKDNEVEQKPSAQNPLFTKGNPFYNQNTKQNPSQDLENELNNNMFSLVDDDLQNQVGQNAPQQSGDSGDTNISNNQVIQQLPISPPQTDKKVPGDSGSAANEIFSNADPLQAEKPTNGLSQSEVMQVLLNFENDFQTQIKQTTLASFGSQETENLPSFNRLQPTAAIAGPTEVVDDFQPMTFASATQGPLGSNAVQQPAFGEPALATNQPQLGLGSFQTPPQQIIQNQIGTDTTTQTVLPVVITTTTTAVPIVQDECFARSCDQTIMGRQLIYARALEIVQSEEYLNELILTLFVKRRLKRASGQEEFSTTCHVCLDNAFSSSCISCCAADTGNPFCSRSGDSYARQVMPICDPLCGSLTATVQTICYDSCCSNFPSDPSSICVGLTTTTTAAPIEPVEETSMDVEELLRNAAAAGGAAAVSTVAVASAVSPPVSPGQVPSGNPAPGSVGGGSVIPATPDANLAQVLALLPLGAIPIATFPPYLTPRTFPAVFSDILRTLHSGNQKE